MELLKERILKRRYSKTGKCTESRQFFKSSDGYSAD